MGDVHRTYRRLMPQTKFSSGAGTQQPPGDGDNNERRPLDNGRMRRASTACKECQRRRIRCTGAPCTECQAHNRECSFDESADRRRKINARKTQENLNSEREYLNNLLDILRDSNILTVLQLIETLRNCATREEARRTIEALTTRPDPHCHNHSDENSNGPNGSVGYFLNRR